MILNFKDSFWFSTSDTVDSFEQKHCYGGSRVNYGKDQKTILPGDTLEIERDRSFSEELSKTYVFINMQSICFPDRTGRDIKEASYDNNAYAVDLDWENP